MMGAPEDGRRSGGRGFVGRVPERAVVAARGARAEVLTAARRAIDLGGAPAELYRRTLGEVTGARA